MDEAIINLFLVFYGIAISLSIVAIMETRQIQKRIKKLERELKLKYDETYEEYYVKEEE